LPCHVVCAAFGTQRSRELVACGGQDTAVHVFPFADSTRLAMLPGHTSRVTAVAFDKDQRRVLAGSDGGSIRLWDLDTEQGIRSFGTGHRTTVTAVTYHAFGEFIASASEDTHLRIWDVRKKSCLQSYKGVSCGLRAVQFNPNGKWVASGCAQGIVRLYDLTNGKLITELATHQGPITSLQFHPEHLFLAAGSADGTMSLWELDTFQLSFRSDPLPSGSPVSKVLFTTEKDKELLVASKQLLRVYPFSRMSDRAAANIEAPWETCSDLVYSTNSGDVLTVECKGSSLGFSRTALCKKQQPHPATSRAFAPSPARSAPAVAQPVSATPPSRQQVQEQPPPQRHHHAQEVGKQQHPMVFQMNPHQAQQLMQQAAAVSPRTSATPDAVKRGSPVTPSGASGASDDLVEQLLAAAPSMLSIAQRRLTHMRVIRSTWPTDPRSALRHLASIAKAETDCGVVTDFLNAMQNQRMKERVTFDILPEFLMLLVGALGHKQDPIALAALRAARSMNTKFRPKIDETLRGAQFATGVDLAMEARIERCREVQTHFEEILSCATAYSLRKDAVGDEARIVVNEVPSLRRR
jgi:katanin p80 WD40 repeat-containing subunit B1